MHTDSFTTENTEHTEKTSATKARRLYDPPGASSTTNHTDHTNPICFSLACLSRVIRAIRCFPGLDSCISSRSWRHTGLFSVSPVLSVVDNCHFQRSCFNSSSVRMNFTVPSFKRTKPPLGSWLSKVNNSGPPC